MRFKNILTFSLCAALLGLAACQPGDVDEATGTEAAGAATALNTLTEEERAEGWQLLFNGQNFDGWRGFRTDSVPDAWTVQDGTLFMTGDSTKRGGDIMTAQTFDNFELALEYRISECGNSGIMYNVSTESGQPYNTGPEYQVLDATCHPDAREGEDRWPGASYDVYAPARDASNPAGEWNQVRIVVNGNHVEHWLNGEMVVEYEFGSDDWKQRVAESKWATVPTYGLAEAGHIDLQDHDNPVWYRNIKIRPLDGTEAAPAS